jgi:hypothetical protein
MCGTSRLRILAAAMLGALAASGALPRVAGAHGPVAPVASKYLARITSSPARFEAKVVDGDQRMWLRVPPSEPVIVLDYRGAPYLRFTRGGVDVNRNSAMYYLNQTPIAAVPPSSLTATTPPRWMRTGSAHEYSWHDGRLHALATVAHAPGTVVLGKWTIPLRVGGRAGAISGALWRAPDPSIVWFWPIAVLLACALAAWRVRDLALDRRVAGALAVVSIVASAVAALSRGAYGRPTVSVLQIVEIVFVLALLAVGLGWVLSRRAGFVSYLVIGLASVFLGAQLAPTLVDGFVLTALPPFVTRSAAVTCLGSGLSLMLFSFRVGHDPTAAPPDDDFVLDDLDDFDLP